MRVLGSGFARGLAGDIPAAAATMRFSDVTMGRMRVIGAIGAPGIFAVRYLARRKVPDASPAVGVPEKKRQ